MELFNRLLAMFLELSFMPASLYGHKTQAPSGLNPELQAQIKAQMAHILEPAPISWWPLAWGWWAVLVTTLALIGFGIFWAVKHYRTNAYRRTACQQLQSLPSTLTAQEHAQALMRLSKQVALHAYPQLRHQIASQHGQPWLDWLNATTTTPLFDTREAKHWQSILYTQNNPAEFGSPVLSSQVRAWFKSHKSAAKLVNNKKTQGGQHA